MAATSGTRVKTAHGPHNQLIQHNNGFDLVSPNTQYLLRQQGTELVVALYFTIAGFKFSENNGNVTTTLTWAGKVKDEIILITSVSAGIIVASSCNDKTKLVLVVPGTRVATVSDVITVSGKLTALTSGPREVLVAVQNDSSPAGRLLRIDVASKSVLMERPLVYADVDLQVDPPGVWLTITHRRLGIVCTILSTLENWPVVNKIGRSAQVAMSKAPTFQVTWGANPPANSGGGGSCDSCSCCHSKSNSCHSCCSKKLNCCCGVGGGGMGGNAGGTTGGDGSCRPGDCGAPTGGGGVIIGQGGGIGKTDGGGGGTINCFLDLLWKIFHIIRVGTNYAVALDQQYHNFAIIKLDTFAVIQQFQIGRKGFRLALDRESPKLLLINFGRKSVSVVNPSTSFFTTGINDLPVKSLELISPIHFDALAAPIDNFMPSFSPPDTGTFTGAIHTDSLLGGHASTTGPLNCLIIPVIESGQTWSDPDLSKWGAYSDRVLAHGVLDYYMENSFGLLHDINFHIFGRDLPPVGGPVQLPKRIQDYYWPAYTGATLVLTRTSVPAGSVVVFDGRETLSLKVQPDASAVPTTLNPPFAAMVFQRNTDNNFPTVQFKASHQLVVKITGGPTLTLKFTDQSFFLNDDATGSWKTTLKSIETYLDGIIKAAEPNQGNPRLFQKPVATRVLKTGFDFGQLAITVAAVSTAGAKLAVESATASGLGVADDPIGLGSVLVGSIAPANTATLGTYLTAIFAITESNNGFHDDTRRIQSIFCTLSSGTLTTTFTIGDSIGGPTASLAIDSSSNINDLFTTSAFVSGSLTNFNNRQAVHYGYGLVQDAWHVAVTRLLAAGRNPNTDFMGMNVALVIPMEPAVTMVGDPNSPQPGEMWSVTPLGRPFDFRGYEGFWTVADTGDPTIQLQSVWSTVFNHSPTDPKAGQPDLPLICHEMGHGIGFRDLYSQTGYREDLEYLDDWALMASHFKQPHHCGYHKWEASWITDQRIIEIPPVEAGGSSTTEILLVPIELWDDSFVNDSRNAFGVGADIQVVQLVQLDLGGDGAVFDFIEARQKGAQFSQSLPSAVPAIIITNALEPWDDQRYAFNDQFRRELQLLNGDSLLTKKGDTFDLAKAHGLPAKGIVVSVLDIKAVGSATVFHIQVQRTNPAFVDLYFTSANPYYRNPDLWVDWAGDNPTKDPADHDKYPVGQPVDQGETLRVPPNGTELHWVVARVRNRGGVAADQVKLNFSICIPMGGGDSSGKFQPIGSTTLDQVPGGDVPTDAVIPWNVPAGFPGHSCLLVEIADYKIPHDSGGAALASDDVWIANNHAQKNVDRYVPLQNSPYGPIQFDYSVHNSAIMDEIAYLEPDQLPYGMTLTVSPRSQVVPAKQTVIFKCTLTLDDSIIDAGCRSDRHWRLTTWRVEKESTTRWGGVDYKVQPRKGCVVAITGIWDYSGNVTLNGKVTPDPGGGEARFRLNFTGVDTTWVTTSVGTGGTFTWKGPGQGTKGQLITHAVFEGNLLYGPAESPSSTFYRPPPIT